MGFDKRLPTSRYNLLQHTIDSPIHNPGMDFSVTESMRRDINIGNGGTPEQQDSYFDAFYSMFGGSGLLNLQTAIKRMEVKVIMSALMATGLVSYIAAIFLNLNNWRSNALFILGATFMVIRICVYIAKSYQDYRIKEWELQEKKREAKKPR